MYIHFCFAFGGVVAFRRAVVRDDCVLCTLVDVSNLYLQLNTSPEIVRTKGCLETCTFVLTTVQGGSRRKSGSRTLTRN
jgi:hypothetical protein